MSSSVRLALALCACSLAFGARSASAEQYYLIVSGIGGQPNYEQAFRSYSESLADAARRTVTDDSQVSVLAGEDATADAVTSSLNSIAEAAGEADSVAVFLVGHGSYDGEEYKLNLSGPDLTGTQLAELLGTLSSRSQLVVNMTSASGAVLEAWAGEGRTLITATRSGAERNATRFAEYWAEALSSDEADLNKNGVVTAQEAFDFTSRQVADSYESQDALATEHPQLVGDGAPRFDAARLVARVLDTPELVELNAELEALEQQIEELRLRREEMDPDQYLSDLQGLLVQLALVQREIEAAGGAVAE